MANIIRRGEHGVAPTTGFDPFETMRELLGWEPIRQLSQLEQTFVPKFEVKETKDAYVFKADLPGVEESELDITLTGNRLTVSGKREAEKQDESENYFTYERTYGTFTRSFTLPEGIDDEHVNAEMKNGVLTLTVPKKPEHQPKKISLKAVGEKVKGMFGKDKGAST